MKTLALLALVFVGVPLSAKAQCRFSSAARTEFTSCPLDTSYIAFDGQRYRALVTLNTCCGNGQYKTRSFTGGFSDVTYCAGPIGSGEYIMTGRWSALGQGGRVEFALRGNEMRGHWWDSSGVQRDWSGTQCCSC
ncbi:unnamed protein product [Vitrella brassicaformis CCMP3155]|uniref:Cyanovirin-N domain-containing protein n=2 Tax=Vitrella brassicaformis TaxID=1169539 RepID=A0A0G4F4A5_VITBC|nr:unnamed protein product [Vitrella brassicaformis CCMP3155]|mmetsp:Transcript_51086/g.128212  ORF Transcript_51086/g.128212 Transcript_51086/m.128212 type:complete len:135 (+) Transcript_51086:223-627(+)|eukprot:CEM06702.1 unnamed protein product [Vitrella brassicaformis CCMP3155]